MRARQAGPGGGGGPAKRLVIKPLRPPSLPADFELATWRKLQAAVRAVHEKRPVECSLEELYRAVEDLCAHKLAAPTYARLQEECERHTDASLRALASAASDPSAFLGAVHGAWSDHCQQRLTLRAIFLVLDRTYPLQTPGVRSLWDMGLQHFRAHLLALPDVLARAVSGLLLHVRRERQGEQPERSALHALVRMLCALGLYGEHFEAPLLQRTAEYYAAEATRLLGATTVGEYLRHVEGRLGEEGGRVAAYLHAGTRKPLLAAVHGALLTPHAEALLEKGFDALVQEGRTDDLQRMHALFAHVGKLRLLRDAWAAHIKRVGSALVLDQEGEAELIPALLQLKAKCDGLHAQAFERAELFGYALREAFEAVLNARPNRPAELLAKFLDAQLRAGAKGGGGGGAGEDELEGTLDRAMGLFRYLGGKDMFEAFHRKELAKRLLLGKAASLDAEKGLVSKLKAQCGAGFTNKLEGMFRDMELSAELNAAFEQRPRAAGGGSNGAGGADGELSVCVLTTGFWPHYPPVALELPAELGRLQEAFGAFYLSRHSGRRLSWVPSLSHCVVRAAFAARPHELQLSLLQAAVCLLFNSADNLSLEQIQEGTGIDLPELKLTLQSLACGKVRVLSKEPKGREVEGGDAFSFHAGLQHRLFRIKVNSIQSRESAQEHEATEAKVCVDRQYQIDAAIVRTMKARRSLTHTLLLSELYEQLQFPVKPIDLKKRIESLIDREYLERDPKVPASYRYLA